MTDIELLTTVRRAWVTGLTDDDLSHLTNTGRFCNEHCENCVWQDIDAEQFRRRRVPIDRWSIYREGNQIMYLVCPDAKFVDEPAHRPVACYREELYMPVECSCGKVFSTKIEDRDYGINNDGTDILNSFRGPKRLPAI